MSEKSTSKFISLILRHHPEVIGVWLTKHVPVKYLNRKIRHEERARGFGYNIIAFE